MSHHEGVVCEACMKEDFKGRRFKCLKCFDYDLCSNCYDAGVTSPRHSADHPMQCILTRDDLELYYGGDTSCQPQAFTCPFCGRMGLTETVLREHVISEHPDSSTSLLVLCPICVARPGDAQDQNLLPDDFLLHLQTQHQNRPRFQRHPVRLRPQPTRRVESSRIGSEDISEFYVHFSEGIGAHTDNGPRLAAVVAQETNSVVSQIQQLQGQLRDQLDRRQQRVQQVERLIRLRGNDSSTTTLSTNNSVSIVGPRILARAPGTSSDFPYEEEDSNSDSDQSHNSSSQFLIKFTDAPRTESEQLQFDVDCADRSFYMQELFLSMLAPDDAMPSTTNTRKDQLSLATSAQPQISQTLAKSIVSDTTKQQQTNITTGSSSISAIQPYGAPHRLASPPSHNIQPVMQSQIPQPTANVRKQPKFTGPSASN